MRSDIIHSSKLQIVKQEIMEFDWNLLEPGREITPAQKSVVEGVALTFLESGYGTAIHQKNLELRAGRSVLNEVQQLGLIEFYRNQCYPRFPALYFLPHAIRTGYATYLNYILEAISALFEARGPGRFSIEDVEKQTVEVLKTHNSAGLAQEGPDEIYFNRAAWFLRDFPASVMAEDSSNSDIPVGSVIPTDRMYDFADLQTAWQLEFQNPRGRFAYLSPAPPSPPEPIPATVASASDGPVPSPNTRASWQIIGEPLGEGGQSTVHLVRGPERAGTRTRDIEKIIASDPWSITTAEERVRRTGEFAEAVASYARSDATTELGAMKVFKVRETGRDEERLRQEVELLEQKRPGLPRLLGFNLGERWIITELFPRGTLERNHSLYKGEVRRALKAFLSLVKTVEALHANGIVHRDIKPANVFVRDDDRLVLGDLGIVYVPDQPDRCTLTNESVGPHDYMPPWADIGGRLGEVNPNFDIYMLGKLLWCMVSGRLRLQREWFERPDYDLTVLFDNDPAMHMVNAVLRRCLVEKAEECHTSATDLIQIVSTYIQVLERGGQLMHVGVPRPCRVCGRGEYRTSGYASTQPPLPADRPVGLRLWVGSSDTVTVSVFPFVCDNCGHVEFFTRGATQPGIKGSLE